MASFSVSHFNAYGIQPVLYFHHPGARFLLALITLFSNATRAAAETIDVKYYGINWDPANGIMSALLPTADIHQGDGRVRKVPGREISANIQPGERANARAGESMTEAHPMVVGAATVFVVSNIARSIEYYRDAVGFTVTFQYGNPTFYACLCRDEVALHLLAAHQTKRLPGNGGICVFVTDVDRVHADLAARGANVIKAPQNYDYGMRDFDVVDLDGNQLTFGMESVPPS